MQRVLSGMRPTGRMHLGNYVGALSNWINMQDGYDCLFMVADWHMLTTGYEQTAELEQNLKDMVIDWLSAGIDPDRSTVFIQSQVPMHAELHLLLSMLTPLSWLTRNPSLKEMVRNSALHKNLNYGLVGYPVLQAADVVIYKADAVPVGEDQLPHLELTRELCRRFNSLYGDIFREPEAILSRHPRLPGLDGKRMSKSAGNFISLSDPADAIATKLRSMITDPEKVRRGDPGRPEVCLVHSLREALNLEPESVTTGCRSGELGCVPCKSDMTERMLEFLKPFAERRQELVSQPELLADVLSKGRDRATEIANQTMSEVRSALGLAYDLMT